MVLWTCSFTSCVLCVYRHVLLFLLLTIYVNIYQAEQISWMRIGSYIAGNQTNEQSGWSVSLSSDGSIVAIGSPYYNTRAGRVRVYRNSSSGWKQWGVDIVGTQHGEQSGISVSLSKDGSTVAIGSLYYGGYGRVCVYRNSGSGWTQWGTGITGFHATEYCGCSVSLSSDGSTVAVGSSGYGINSTFIIGRVRVYHNAGSGWRQWGVDIVGTQHGEQSGISVSLSSNGAIVAIGSPSYYYDITTAKTSVGRVRIYRNSSSGWRQWGADIVGNQTNEQSGSSVSLSKDGSTVAIGSPRYATTTAKTNVGRVRVYRNSSSGWRQWGADIVGNLANEQSGYSVSLSKDGSTVAIGSPYYNTSGGSDIVVAGGRVCVYRKSGSGWKQWGVDIGGTQDHEYNGFFVSLSYYGNITATGSAGYASNTGRVAIYVPVVTPSSQPTGQPTSQPSQTPTRQPTGQPSTQPSTQPSNQPTVEPSRVPWSSPSSKPSSQPSSQPSKIPSSVPSSSPSTMPSSDPSNQPIVVPSSLPSSSPSCDPSSQPSRVPSSVPSSSPSTMPSSRPSNQPTVVPSSLPSSSPSSDPSSQPSRVPSSVPSSSPSTMPSLHPSNQPTVVPSSLPSSSPSSDPSSQPSRVPSSVPSSSPSTMPSLHPSNQPTVVPSSLPSSSPSSDPSSQPSRVPSSVPSSSPSTMPSSRPSNQPTVVPSSLPSSSPSSDPSSQPSRVPSSVPSSSPSTMPSSRPSNQPTVVPSSLPLSSPSSDPSSQPSRVPSSVPSSSPSTMPSSRPSNQPTVVPSSLPLSSPSSDPSSQPSRVPSSVPSSSPSTMPSSRPSNQPTVVPSSLPSSSPSSDPSSQPSRVPSSVPSSSPSTMPSSRPSSQPSRVPSSLPSSLPSKGPSSRPSSQPSRVPPSLPSSLPSKGPSSRPSSQPTVLLSDMPFSFLPSNEPSSQPSSTPTAVPSATPYAPPSKGPSSSQPSSQPTVVPSTVPSSSPYSNTCPSRGLSHKPSICSPSLQPSARPSTRAPSTSDPSRNPSSSPTHSLTTTGQSSSHPSSMGSPAVLVVEEVEVSNTNSSSVTLHVSQGSVNIVGLTNSSSVSVQVSSRASLSSSVNANASTLASSLKSDIFTITASNTSSSNSLQFTANISLTVSSGSANASSVPVFRYNCSSQKAEQVFFNCSETNVTFELSCSGAASAQVAQQCPVPQQRCSVIDMNTFRVVDSNYCTLVSSTATSMQCRCGYSSSSSSSNGTSSSPSLSPTLSRSLSMSVGVTSQYVTQSFSGTVSGVAGLSDATAVKGTMMLLSTFACLWIIGILLMGSCMWQWSGKEVVVGSGLSTIYTKLLVLLAKTKARTTRSVAPWEEFAYVVEGREGGGSSLEEEEEVQRDHLLLCERWAMYVLKTLPKIYQPRPWLLRLWGELLLRHDYLEALSWLGFRISEGSEEANREVDTGGKGRVVEEEQLRGADSSSRRCRSPPSPLDGNNTGRHGEHLISDEKEVRDGMSMPRREEDWRKVQRIAAMLTSITLSCFLLAWLYDLQYPDDDGSCEQHTTLTSCLEKRSMLDSSQSYCVWKAAKVIKAGLLLETKGNQILSSQSVQSSLTDEELRRQCQFSEQDASLQAFLVAAMMVSLISAVLNRMVSALFALIEAPTACASTAADVSGKVICLFVLGEVMGVDLLHRVAGYEASVEVRRCRQAFVRTLEASALASGDVPIMCGMLRGEVGRRGGAAESTEGEVCGIRADAAATALEGGEGWLGRLYDDELFEQAADDRALESSRRRGSNRQKRVRRSERFGVGGDEKRRKSSIIRRQFNSSHWFRQEWKMFRDLACGADDIEAKAVTFLHVCAYDLIQSKDAKAAKIWWQTARKDYTMRPPPVLWYVKWICVLVLITANIGAVLFIMLRGLDRSSVWQGSFLKACAVQWVMDEVFASTVTILCVDVAVPGLVYGEVLGTVYARMVQVLDTMLANVKSKEERCVRNSVRRVEGEEGMMDGEAERAAGIERQSVGISDTAGVSKSPHLDLSQEMLELLLDKEVVCEGLVEAKLVLLGGGGSLTRKLMTRDEGGSQSEKALHQSYRKDNNAASVRQPSLATHGGMSSSRSSRWRRSLWSGGGGRDNSSLFPVAVARNPTMSDAQEAVQIQPGGRWKLPFRRVSAVVPFAEEEAGDATDRCEAKRGVDSERRREEGYDGGVIWLVSRIPISVQRLIVRSAAPLVLSGVILAWAEVRKAEYGGVWKALLVLGIVSLSLLAVWTSKRSQDAFLAAFASSLKKRGDARRRREQEGGEGFGVVVVVGVQDGGKGRTKSEASGDDDDASSWFSFLDIISSMSEDSEEAEVGVIVQEREKRQQVREECREKGSSSGRRAAEKIREVMAEETTARQVIGQQAGVDHIDYELEEDKDSVFISRLFSSSSSLALSAEQDEEAAVTGTRAVHYVGGQV